MKKNLLICIFILTVLALSLSFTGFKVNESPVQPDPVITRNLVTNLPTDDSKIIYTKLKFNKQMPPSEITKRFDFNKIDIVELGWEWKDHKTYYPVEKGLTIANALSGLKEYQIKYLKYLANEMPKIHNKLLKNGQDEKAKNLEIKIKNYKNQLNYVKNNPIKIAHFCMIGTVEQVKEIAMENNLVIDDFQLINSLKDKNEIELKKALEIKAKIEAEAMKDTTIQSYSGYQPDNGGFMAINDTDYNGGPYLSHYVSWDDISGFTSTNHSYEHDTKINPWVCTECRNTHFITLGPHWDCAGPWSEDFPSSTYPYLDTRACDIPEEDGKDFTIGLKDARNLQTDEVYVSTIYTNFAGYDGSVYVVPQLAHWANTTDEEWFCDEFKDELGESEACIFATASDVYWQGGAYDLVEGERHNYGY